MTQTIASFRDCPGHSGTVSILWSNSPDMSSPGIICDDSQQKATERTRLLKIPQPSSPSPYTSTSEVKLDEQHIVTKSYLVRWYVLLVYCLHLASNNLMWATTSPITDIVACYYGLSLWWINALSWTSMLVYVVFFLPVARFVDTYGLRATAIVGGCMNAVGCWLGYAGTSMLCSHHLFVSHRVCMHTPYYGLAVA